MKRMKHMMHVTPQTARRTLATAAGAFLATLACLPASASAQSAAPASQTFQVSLSPLNNSGTSGSATLTLTGTQLKVSMKATGASANLPHALHIQVGGQAKCPVPAADKDGDKLINGTESIAYTGPAKVSLTTSGDTSAKSVLSVERMPKADAKGNISYDRTFTLPAGVTAADMTKASIDLHGISSLYDDKAKYDGSKKSDLYPALPFEATVPAACGVLSSAPTSGAATGAGSVDGIESPALFVAGAAALAAAGGAVIIARKQLANGRD